MRLPFGEGFLISDIDAGDKAAFLEHLQEKQIYDQTLNIPHPYTEAAADWWIHHVAEETKKQGRSVNWAIRREDGYLIGGIGYHDIRPGFRAEIGYWLAKEYWNRGIMTRAVSAATDYGFAQMDLARVTASVFSFNEASSRVLAKAGYQREGLLRKHFKKDDRYIDGIIFGRLRED